MAERKSSAEMEQFRLDYEKKKATLGQMQTLEQAIAAKAVDNSAVAHKDASKTLAEGVKELAERKSNAPLEKEKTIPLRSRRCQVRNAYIFCAMTHWQVEAMTNKTLSNENAVYSGSFDYGFYSYFP